MAETRLPLELLRLTRRVNTDADGGNEWITFLLFGSKPLAVLRCSTIVLGPFAGLAGSDWPLEQWLLSGVGHGEEF